MVYRSVNGQLVRRRQPQSPLWLHIRDLFVAGIYFFQGFFFPDAEKSSRDSGEGSHFPSLYCLFLLSSFP